MYIENDFIKKNSVEHRDYQVKIARSSLDKNTLLVLPTGLGKTIVALYLIIEYLKKEKNKKILFLAPTKPLVMQHFSFLNHFLTIDKKNVIVFTGEVSPKKRIELWKNNRIIISTPQVIENDVLSKRINLDEVCFLIFDEAHHAIGQYAYVFINEMYQKNDGNHHLLAMTASPGGDLEKITEVCKNLSINNVEIRTQHDPDVRAYVHDIKFIWKDVILPDDFSFALNLLQKALRKRLKELKDINVIDSSSVTSITKTKLLDAQRKIQSAIRSELNPPKRLFIAAAVQSEAMKLQYAIEILQTQGVQSVKQFLLRIYEESLKKNGSKSSKNLSKDPLFIETRAYLSTISIEHPKLDEVQHILTDYFQKNPDSRVIIFTHFRDTSQMVYDRLKDNTLIKPVRFIGQGSKEGDKGLTQQQQRQIVNNFRRGVFNVLIATSVAEEGLDIPSTELVLFYEPIPSEIRNIQRRGRTARNKPGQVVILITKGTSDEGYYWASKRKEKHMRAELELLRATLKRKLEIGSSKDLFYNKQINDQKSLKEYVKEEKDDICIIVDHREYRSSVVRSMVSKNVNVKPEQLPVADYIISQRVGVERKQVDDFLNSLINGMLFQQIKKLRDTFPRPVLIIEGDGLFTKRNISHQAIYGCLVSILIDYGVAIITTENGDDTADLLIVMAKREQQKEKKSVVIRGDKHGMSLAEQQQYIIEGFPQISSVMAKRLLEYFGSIRAIVNATEEDLREVKGVGKQIATSIYNIFNEQYKKNS